ncbi:MAG: multifunctional oxoglutarate decarboxylase/oxoglutarate dehydrogenase thiamine pyrophosphate-binding subunit/dihydrolipoyllysine-residue succinyltransferase subunit, partial [Cellulosimicrobium funkei]
RQAYARPRRPLIVFTPKQLLRLKAAASSVEDFTTGTFRPVIPDASADPAKVDRVLLCTGRVYYDLLAERTKRGDEGVALVRLEQLYPLDVDGIRAELAKYPGAEVVWVQDEPENQGAWSFVHINLPEDLPRVSVVSRPASASTAAGTAKKHQAQQAVLLEQAFAR